MRQYVRLCMVWLLSAAAVCSQAQITANFFAEESSVTYYQQGWDTADEASEWTYTNNLGGASTWQLTDRPQFSGQAAQPPYSTIEAGSQKSLAIMYANNDKDETATSPTIDIRENSTVEYYLSLYAVWYVYADLKFYVTDTQTGERTQLVSTFAWAQSNGYTGPNWEKFVFDLSPWAGKKVTFSFNYAGAGGENVFIDGFKVRQSDRSAASTVNIFSGTEVHFTDASEGTPTQWQWTFEGGSPATSSEQHPTVTYSTPGSYSVSLTVSDGNTSDTYTREAYIHVSDMAPKALIGTPIEGYLSPYAYCFVPTGTPLQFRDLSTGNPTQWQWTFEGATPATSSEQNPTVVYQEAGTYGLSLSVSNAAGSSEDILSSASIQAGGQQEVWNILPEETASDQFGAIALGFYGYYAGTNWMGMEAFAEHYHAPAVPAEIDAVNIYFYSTTTVSPSVPITVSLRKEAADGMPGETLAESTLTAGELAYDAHNVVPTTFAFSPAVTVSEPFFVVVSGIPHTDNGSATDDIAIYCIRRADGAQTTSYHYLEEWDDHYQPTGEYAWYVSDEPISMAVAPRLRYVTEATGIAFNVNDNVNTQHPSSDTYYDLQGRPVSNPAKGSIYIRNGKKILYKN